MRSHREKAVLQRQSGSGLGFALLAVRPCCCLIAGISDMPVFMFARNSGERSCFSSDDDTLHAWSPPTRLPG